MPKVSLSPESIKLARLIHDGIQNGRFGRRFTFYHVNAGSVRYFDDSLPLISVLKMEGFIPIVVRHIELDIFNELQRQGYIFKERDGNQVTLEIEQRLLDLVDRDFEIEPPSTSISITAQQANITITRADAITIINNNAELADALEERLQKIISQEHAFIFAATNELYDAINELRDAVDDAQKTTALQKILGVVSHTNDVYGILQIMKAIGDAIASVL